MNKLMNKRVAFLSLGCKVNAYETEAIKEQFLSYGCIPVDFKEEADVYVVNTCTVTNIADKKSRQMLRRAKTINPDAVVVAVGCYVQESADLISEEKLADLLVGNRLKASVARFTEEYLEKTEEDGKRIICYTGGDMEDYEDMSFLSDYSHKRVDVKIQDGCGQFCSYCIIPYARGRICSRNTESILSEIKSLADKGFKEVILTGIHVSSFGLDDVSRKEQLNLVRDDGRMPLAELIESINEIEGIKRIRLSSLEPRIITREFVSRLFECEKLMPHFHLSLQSGSDTVLRRMNRKYDTARYLEACDILREYYYRPSITTDIIVGFPGETEEEYLETEAFARKADFARIHIFPYSKREGTAAARMDGQLSAEEKAERAKRLSSVEEELRKNYEESLVGEQRTVLVESVSEEEGRRMCHGFTPEYVKLSFENDMAEPGDIIELTVDSVFVDI